MTVAVVTDSACDLPPEAAEGIAVVPLHVAFGGETYRDREELSAEEFWARMDEGGGLPTTSSPGPDAFLEAYARAAEEGAAGIVSVHLSERLSRAIQSARAAAERGPVPIEVVDTRSVSLGQGLVARAAHRAAADGADLAAAAGAAREAATRLEVVAMLDGVDHLRRGGRVGRAKAALSGLLRIRPVLGMEEGEPALVGRPRTRSRGVEDLLARARGPALATGVLHSGAPESEDLAERVEEATGSRPLLSLVGAVTGTHLGPRALGVAVLRPPA